MAGAISMAGASPLLPLSPSPLSSSSSSSFLPSVLLRRIRRQKTAALRSELRILSHRKYPPHASVTAAATNTAWSGDEVLEVAEIKERSQKWLWRGRYSINYFVQPPLSGGSSGGGKRPPLVLVHGFGASIPHWRRNIMTLAQDQMVYVIDLLGFGLSDKPAGFAYTMETWAEITPLGSFSTVALGFPK